MTVINKIVTEAQGKGITNFVPTQQRLRWEQQWLNENKSAFNVIKGGANTASYQGTDLQVSPNQKKGDERTAINLDSLENIYTVSDEAKTVGIASGKTTPTRQPQAMNIIQNPIDPESPSLLIRRQETYTVSTALAGDADKLYRRQELRQFAVWRDGKKVAVSMRLPKELQDDPSISLALGQWLADAGLKLLSLIINGKLHSKS